jgi:signal transduction histidine kinase
VRTLLSEPMTLIDRLALHDRLRGVPRAELEWLAAHGVLRTLVAGEFLAHLGESRELHQLYIILAGRLGSFVDRDGVQRKVRDTSAGEFEGVFPFSRMSQATADVIVEEALEILCIDPQLFPTLIQECPAVTAACVHSMLDRARTITQSDLHDEKMFSLGKLAAGLAHELNNPASAAIRSVDSLAKRQSDLEATLEALSDAGLSASQRATVHEIRAACLANIRSDESPIPRAEREEAIAEWLASRRIESDDAASLAEAGVTLEHLDMLECAIPVPSLGLAIAWVASSMSTAALLSEIGRAVQRMHNLITAVKGFTQMDRPLVTEPTSIAPGVRDSLAVIGAKARSRSITIDIDVPDDLPRVRASAAELNQVWASLLDNALDAAPTSSHIAISARVSGGSVVLSVVDQGAGIPDAIKSRVFDPFFTTKPIGQGRGLGLDIARRIVMMNGGRIEFDSVPGHTEFRVFFPFVPRGTG